MLDLEKDELVDFEKEDEIVNEFRNKIFELNENEGFINDFTKEQEAMLMHNTAKKIAYKEGESFGMEEGERKSRLEIAKNLITLKIPEEQIVIATGLTLKELESLK